MDTFLIAPNYEKWDRPVFIHPSLQAFLSTRTIKNGIHAITVNGHPIDFLFHKKPCDNLLVVFNGAVARNSENTPPFFSGIGISANAKCSIMAINDPSIYLDPEITMAWYAGSNNLPLQSILVAIIDKVASVSASRIIMAGGSAGGFASLYYATETAQPSIAVVGNPQTNISKYFRGHVQRYARVCFDWHEGNVESAFSDITYDLVEHYTKKRAPTIYLQYSTDWHHIKNHAIPFLKGWALDWTGTDQTGEGLYVRVGNWGSGNVGHIAPPRSLYAHIISQLCTWETSWNEAVNSAHTFFEANIKPPVCDMRDSTTRLFRRFMPFR